MARVALEREGEVLVDAARPKDRARRSPTARPRRRATRKKRRSRLAASGLRRGVPLPPSSSHSSWSSLSRGSRRSPKPTYGATPSRPVPLAARSPRSSSANPKGSAPRCSSRRGGEAGAAGTTTMTTTTAPTEGQMNRLTTLFVCTHAHVTAAAPPPREPTSPRPQYGAGGLHSAVLGSSYRHCGRRRSRSRCSTSRPRRAASPRRRVGDSRRRLALRGPRPPYTFRTSTRTPRTCCRGAPGHLRRGARAGPDRRAAPGRCPRRRRLERPAFPPCRSASSSCPTTRALGELRKDFANVVGTFSESDGRRRRAPRVRGRRRDHRPRSVRGGSRQPRRPVRSRGTCATALRRARLRLRPPPRAVAVGAQARGPAVAPIPRTATRRSPVRGLLVRTARLHPTDAHVRAEVRQYSASRTTGASRTAGSFRSCRTSVTQTART